MTIVLPAFEPALDWSVMVRDLDSRQPLAEFGRDRVLQTASIGKLFVLLCAARQLADGLADPDEVLRPGSADDLVADSGLLHLFRQPEIRLADACLLVGAVSDNLATNLLIERFGLVTIQQLARQLGYADSTILDKVRTERTPDLPPTLSLGRADELSDLAARLATGAGIGPSCSLVEGWLANDTDTSLVAGAFGVDPLAHRETDDGWLLRHKTGAISTARADVGWVRCGQDGPGVAYAVLVNWPADLAPEPRPVVLRTMRAIGEALRLHLRPDAH